jgi:hypothetical protein
MFRLPVRLALAVSALWLAGCVDGSIDPQSTSDLGTVVAGGSGGVAGSAAQAGGGAATAGASAGTSAGQSAAGASVSAGGAMACSSYMDAAGYALPVHIKNVSTKTLYLGQQTMTCQPERLFQVEDGSRALLPSVDNCHTSCQAVMQGSAVTCSLACAVPTTVTLAPGQTIDIPWDGRFGVPQTLPQNCISSASATSTACIQARQVEAAFFTFTAQAGTNRMCLDPSGKCTCTPNANGTCSTPSSLITGTIITTEFLVKLEPGEKSPSGEPQYIGLEFKDVAN